MVGGHISADQNVLVIEHLEKKSINGTFMKLTLTTKSINQYIQITGKIIM